jgi:hypothetical protein
MLPSQRVLEGRQGAFLVFGEPAVIDAIAWQSAMSSLAAFPREVVRLDFDAKSLRLEWVELEADPQVVELAFRICGEWLACAPAGATAIR